ncbi:hypothetical protein FIV37_06385 [Pseudomonas gessardii]|nr:hypothetical protein [Pseudomonas gessardii]
MVAPAQGAKFTFYASKGAGLHAGRCLCRKHRNSPENVLVGYVGAGLPARQATRYYPYAAVMLSQASQLPPCPGLPM